MSAPPLPGVLGDLAPVLNHWGYWAVGGLLFVEDFGVPAPGETILIAAALYAGAGQLNIVAVIAIGIAAAILGDNVGYLIGRTGGHALILRYGKYILLTPERFEKAERFFTRHGGKVVTIARFVEGLRQANGIIAGTTKMPWRRFLAFNALGAALWVGVWAGVGYAAGDHITTIYRQVNRYSLYVLAALGAVVVAFVVRAVVRRRRARSGGSESSEQREPSTSPEGPERPEKSETAAASGATEAGEESEAAGTPGTPDRDDAPKE